MTGKRSKEILREATVGRRKTYKVFLQDEQKTDGKGTI